MKNSKSIFSSKTIIGSLIALAAMVKMIWGVEISDVEITTILGDLDTVVNIFLAIVGTVTTIYGRFTAKGNVHVKK